MLESLISLLLATFLLLGSPGPATMALAATGATHGFKKGLPFLLGILAGLVFVITGAALGLAALFASFPSVKIVLQIAGAGYILFLAWKIASAPLLNTSNNEDSHIPHFFDGFIVNLLNVKAYAVFLAIFSQFLLPNSDMTLAYISTGTVCIIMGIIIDVIWLWLGSAISPFFSDPVSARRLRVSLAVLMVAAVTVVFIR